MTETWKIEIIRDETAYFQLAEDWNDFLATTRANSVFLTWEYLANWWKAYGEHYELLAIVARNASDELIGIAPLMTGRGHTFPRNSFRHLTFIGGLGDSLAEYQDFLVEPGFEQEFVATIIRLLLTDLIDDWDLISFPLMRETSSTLPALVQNLPQHGSHVVQFSSRPAPYIELPDSWEAFIRSKSKNFKKQFQNQWNRLHKRHELEWLEAGTDLDVKSALDVVSELNKSRWGSKGDTFKSKQFNEFHERLATSFAEKEWLYLRLLKIDGMYAAARYDFVYDGKLWNYQNGWLPELGHLSLGKMMIGDCVKWCIDHGYREYDFLAGETAYKKSWATHVRHLITIEVANPSKPKSLAFQQLRRVKNALERRNSAKNQAA